MLLTVREIAKELDGEIIGNKDYKVNGICDIEKGTNGCISYIQSDLYLKYLNETKASVIIVNKKLGINDYSDKIFIIVENASQAFIKLLKNTKYYLNPIEKSNAKSNLDIGQKTKISKNAILGKNVTIGENCKIFSGCYIGDYSIIGANTILYPNVVIYNHIIIGDSCKIDSGTTIGSDGFGITQYENKNHTIPHIGKVIIGNNVDIGSNCCIDRGTINNTVIGDNSRLDNQIQIAHNVILGKNCIIAGQVAIAGSTKIGNNVTIAGQCGIIDHLEIGKNSTVAAKSFVTCSMEENSFVSGNPAVNHQQRLKQDIALRKLPSLLKKIKF